MRTIILGLLCFCCGQTFAQEQSTSTVIPIRDSMVNLGKPGMRKDAVKELRKAGYPAFKGLRSLAKNTGKGRDERIAAVLLAGEIVKASTVAAASEREGFRKDAETMLASDKDDFVREASAMALGKLGDKNSVKSLKAGLNDKSANVRMRSAWALAKNGDYSGKEVAIKGLKSSNVTEQVLAVDALEEVGDKTSIAIIRENLSSDNVWSRINTALAIKRIEYKNLNIEQKIPYLEEAARDKQAEVRNWAVGELTKRISEAGGDRDSALSALKKIAKDPDNPAASKAAKSLSLLLKIGSVQWSELSN